MSNLDGSDRRLPAPDALEPVAMLIIALVEMNFVRSDDAIEDLGITRHQRLRLFAGRTSGITCRHGFVARNENPAFGSVKLDAVRVFARDRHPDPVCVPGFGFELAVDVPESMRWKLSRAPDFDRTCVLSVHSPVRGIDLGSAQPVIIPAPNCSHRSHPGRSKLFCG